MIFLKMHAVVLLYNYYHRKQCPELEFLGFEPFCKVAVNARSGLLMHMKFMQRCNDKSGNLDKQFSVTEEMVMEACDIAKALDASKEAPDIGGWPISKVAVLVVDSMKKNCLLQFSSIVHGVWSLVEKNLDVPISSVKLHSQKSSGNESLNGQLVLDKFAFSAVKEETGIAQKDLTILEQHHAYSLSKGKGATRFYLMQCNKPINDTVVQVPIKDAISSYKNNTLDTAADSSQLVLDCSSNGGDDWTLKAGNLGNVEDDSASDRSDQCEQTMDASENVADRINKAVNKEENGGHGGVGLGSVSRIQPMADKCSISCPAKRPSDDTTMAMKNIQETQTDKRKKPLIQNGSKATGASFKEKGGVVVSSCKPCAVERGIKVKNRDDAYCNGSSIHNGAIVVAQPLHDSDPNSQHLDKVKVVLASKGNQLLQTALRVLQKKQDDLSHRHRQLAEEIAQCEKNIQAISRGGEDCLALEIESIIEACNAAICQDGPGRGSHDVKRKRLAEAKLILRTPCQASTHHLKKMFSIALQELDEICSVNNWILPRYSVSPSIGGFVASVIVQGMDFEFSGSGEERANPREAREAAATAMVSKLRHLASQLK
ncbi:hypothetical protein ACLOJK_011852 [Asimina triloba]